MTSKTKTPSTKRTSHKKTPSKKRTPAPAPAPAAIASAKHTFDVGQFAFAIHVLNESGFETVAEAIVFCEALLPDVTLADIHKKTGMPFSTLSRLAWGLSQRRLLSYVEHPTDRRKKIIRGNMEVLKGAQ